jgi:hypothetical protein
MKRITKEHIEMLTRRELSGRLPTDNVTLTRKGLAHRWSCSTETIKRREAAGALTALKLGRLVRYRLSDILALEADAEVR